MTSCRPRIDWNELPPLLPIPTAARLAGIPKSSAYRYAAAFVEEPAAENGLPATRLGGRIYILRDGLKDLLEPAGQRGDARG